ncbi:MAG: hypothetical protein V2A34_08985, partial [Lentisphaerota bacterium]
RDCFVPLLPIVSMRNQPITTLNERDQRIRIKITIRIRGEPHRSEMRPLEASGGGGVVEWWSGGVVEWWTTDE